jgi:hypothetical protein
MGQKELRVRAALDTWWVGLVIILVGLAVAGGWLTHTAYVDPGTHVEQRPGPEATYSADFSHSATVQTQNPVFPLGFELSDRTTYFGRLAPVLEGTFLYTYTASDDGELDTRATLKLVVRALGEDSAGQRTKFWQISRPLDSGSATLDPGEQLELTFEENITDLANETDQLDTALGGSPGTIEAAVVAEVETNGRVNDRPVSNTSRYELGIQPDSGTYRVDDPGRVVTSTEQSRSVVVPNSYGPLYRLGGPVLVLLGLAGLAGLIVARRRNALELSAAETAYLDYLQTRDEFADWITVGQPPADALDHPVVEVETLDGLVDVAIDSDRRVIQDRSNGTFLVPVDDFLYRYDAPRRPPQHDGPLSLTTPDSDTGAASRTTPNDEGGVDERDQDQNEAG